MLKRLYIRWTLCSGVCWDWLLVILLKRFDKITPVEVQQAVPEDAILFVEDIDYEYLTETFLPGSRIWIDFVNITGRLSWIQC